MFLRKGFLKICSKFTGEHPCWGVISKTWNMLLPTLPHDRQFTIGKSKTVQPVYIFSKSAMETPEQCVLSVHNQH